jgi:hypothetical protein
LSRAALFVGFFVPFAGFWYRRWLSNPMKIRLSIAGKQGLQF